MKSILFTHFFNRLMNQSKQRTFRVKFCPTYIVDEIVKIDFIDRNINKRETLYQARIVAIYPKQIKSVDHYEAQLDGFRSVKHFRKGIMEINQIKSIERWGFFTLFAKCKTIFDFAQAKEVLTA